MVGRLNSSIDSNFFTEFVYRFPDKQYETWLGGQFVHVGIDYSYHKDLQDRIFAGIANHFMDMSFASALKLVKDKGNDDRIPNFERKFNQVEQRFLSTSNNFLTADRPIVAPEHEVAMHGELFLLRLLSSFHAARYLINLGFFSEPLVILRSALEQLAWCYSVGVMLDDRQFEQPRPSKCIKEFRNRFAPAGLLYGFLSDYSHMEFEAQRHFVTTISGHAGIMRQSTEYKFFGLLTYAFIIIAFQFVCRDRIKFYRDAHNRHYRISNAVLPLRILISHALMRPELDNDELAARLTQIYFQAFGK